MTDCLATLHYVTQDAAASAKVRDGLYIVWATRFKAPERAAIEPQGHSALLALPEKQPACHRARRILETTQKNWSEA